MKSKDLYMAINHIDDDLIVSAMDIGPAQNIIPFRRYAALAARFCIMIVGVLLVNSPTGTDININEVQGLMMKSVDVDMTTRYLSETEVKDYFDEFNLPDKLLLDLTLEEQGNFTFLMDDYNKIYDDTSVFVYGNGDQEVKIKLSKVGLEYGDIFNDGTKKKVSYINNKELMIGSYIDYRMDEEVIEILRYVAEYKYKDIYITISGEGMEQEAFIDILEVVIGLNRD